MGAFLWPLPALPWLLLRPTSNGSPSYDNNPQGCFVFGVHRRPSTVYRLPSTFYRPPSTVYRPPSTVYRPPSTVYRLPSTVHRLPSTVYRPPSTVHCLPFTVYRPPFTVYRLLSTVYRLPSTVYRLPSTVYRLPPGVAAWGSRRAGGVKGRVTLLLLPKQFQKSGCRRSEVIYTAVVYLDACGTGRYNCSSLDNTKHSTCSLQTAVILPPNAPREANAPRVAIFDENENNPDFHIVTPPPLSTFWGERPGAYLVNAPCQSFWGA